MNDKVEVVIPLGPSGKDRCMPNIDYLNHCLKNLKNQTMPVKITIAADKDLQPDRIKMIEKYADKIKYFAKDSWFKPGSIWKKIIETWEESDCKYIAWQGYDDYSSLNRFELQYKMLEQINKNSCFCSNWTNKRRTLIRNNSGCVDFFSAIGSAPNFMPAFLIRKDVLLNTGISNYEDKFAYYFEGFLYLFILKTGIPLICSPVSFYRREHKGTISETYKEQWFIESWKRTGYSLEQCKSDWDSLNFLNMCEEMRKNFKSLK